MPTFIQTSAKNAFVSSPSKNQYTEGMITPKYYFNQVGKKMGSAHHQRKSSKNMSGHQGSMEHYALRIKESDA
jgi:hypothetical protein